MSRLRLFGQRRSSRDDQPSDRRIIHEAFRTLRTNLQVSMADLDRCAVVVTSTAPGEGKTATCAQLAQSLAFARRRVIAVDLDLRHPDLHNWFGVENTKGVSDVLLGKCQLDEAMQYVPIDLRSSGERSGLYVLPTGAHVPDPPELLSTQRVARLVNSLAAQADVVLIDTPPVLPVADTLVIGRMTAGAILVVEAGVTPFTALLRAKDSLVRNHVRLFGLVINKLERRDVEGDYGYGYGYGNGTDGSEEPDTNGHRG
ncbi:MAG: CpsD/CapB family tyrosine-protein kinase [Acidimicrobiales bacterium]